MGEWCEETSDPTCKSPSTYILILGCFEPQCAANNRHLPKKDAVGKIVAEEEEEEEEEREKGGAGGTEKQWLRSRGNRKI